MDEAPQNNSMFNRAGGGTKSKSKDVQSSMAQVLTEAATALTSVLSPKPTATGRAQGARSSPAKLIENRSSLYKQLSELQALKGTGILTEEEYTGEKAAIASGDIEAVKLKNPVRKLISACQLVLL